MKKEMYEIHQQRSKSNWWFKARREIVHSIIDRYIYHNKNNILEVGAGYGIMTEMLKGYGTVTAIEPYPSAAKYLSKTLGIKVHKGTLDTFKTKEKYDIVAMFDVLEHIRADYTALDRIHDKLLKERGMLILTVPAYELLWSKHDELNNHYYRYTRKYLINMMSGYYTFKRTTYFNTLLFPLALLDKLWFARNKQSTALNPSPLINTILYNIFKLEKILLKYFNLPYGVSILLIAEKRS